MDKLFIEVLNNAIVSSYIILAIIVLRTLFLKFIKKIPKWVNCLLWGLVAIKLILPFSVESIFSLIPSAKPVVVDVEYISAPQIDTGISTVNTMINPVIENTLVASETASINPILLATQIISYVWIVGVIGLLIYAIVSYALLKRRVANSELIDKGIYKSDKVDSPFILGIIRPLIYVPDSLADDAYSCVLEHEKAHIKRGDFIWKPLAFLLLSVYWFNPLCWVFYILLCEDIEYACDEKVTKDKDKEWKAKYCQVLLDCSSQRRLVSACPVAFGEVSVKDRIKSVINYKKPSFWIILISIVVAFIVAVCFMTSPRDKKTDTDSLVGVYIKDIAEEDKPLYASALTINEDGTFVYNPSIISSYMGVGTWEKDGVHIIFSDTGMGDVRKEVFLLDEGKLYYIAGESAANSMWQLEDGTEYILAPEDFNMVDDALSSGGESDDTPSQENIISSTDETKNITSLEEAINQAIIDHGSRYAPSSGKVEYKVASFITLEQVETCGIVEEVSVHGMAMYMEANVTDDGIEETSGSHVPTILTFEVTDGNYVLKEYWEPGEGAFYGGSIKENFLPENVEIVMNSKNTEYIQTMDCYDQIIRMSGLDTDRIIKKLLATICSSPSTSSSTADYIKNWPIEYRELIYYGQYTLDYENKYTSMMKDKQLQELSSAILEEACRNIEETLVKQGEQVKNESIERVHPVTGEVKLEKFTPEDIQSLVKIEVYLPDGTMHIVDDMTRVKKIEELLSKSTEVKGLECPSNIPIALYREDGTIMEIFPATDSCDNFLAGGKRYDWGETDSSGLWDLLGVKVDFGESNKNSMVPSLTKVDDAKEEIKVFWRG